MRHLFVGWGLLLGLSAFAQEQLGLRLENYAGASGLTLNPTAHLNNPLQWDINLAGGGLFFENDYGYIQQANVLDLWKNRKEATLATLPELEGPAPQGAYLVDFFRKDKKRHLVFGGYVDGPAVAVKIGGQHSVGLFSRLRAQSGTFSIPDQFGYYEYDALQFQMLADIHPFKGAYMVWSEIGVNYAVKIPTTNGDFSLGANLKMLHGFEGGFVENIGHWGHIKVEDNVVSIGGANGRFGFTNSNFKEEDFKATANGKGFGFDLGASLTIAEYEDSYLWRFGFSVLDIGAVNFTENAQAHRVDTRETIILRSEDYEDFGSIEQHEEALRLFSEQMLGDPGASLQSESFALSLPTALSFQVDRSFSENIFLNAILVQRVSFGGIGPQRPNLFALTPRFEQRWFSASVPLAVYNWQSLRAGLAARLGFLVVGTDHLGSFVGNGNLSGTDFYVALKVNVLELNWSLFGGGGAKNFDRRFGKRGKVKCYDF